MSSGIGRVQRPRRYFDVGSEEWLAYLSARSEESRDDLDFARTVGSIVVEGPWAGRTCEVGYLGIKEGERIALPQLARRWRYQPIRVQLGGGSNKSYFFPEGAIPVTIELGRDIPGALIRRPYGNSPVQSDGVVDGEDFYFRSRGDLWQMHIGGDDIVWAPNWFYQEDYGTWPDAGAISVEQAEDFIEKAFALYRSGFPSMVKERPDFSSPHSPWR